MNKGNKVLLRHKAIKELIKKYPIEDQNSLVTLLKDNYGIETTQPIVSRDLHQLGISKRKVKNKVIYESPQIDIQKEMLRLAICDILYNESTIVIKTMPGTADFVGDFIDLQKDLDIIGTLSGENVVFVAPKSIKEIKRTFKKICSSLFFKK